MRRWDQRVALGQPIGVTLAIRNDEREAYASTDAHAYTDSLTGGDGDAGPVNDAGTDDDAASRSKPGDGDPQGRREP